MYIREVGFPIVLFVINGRTNMTARELNAIDEVTNNFRTKIENNKRKTRCTSAETKENKTKWTKTTWKSPVRPRAFVWWLLVVLRRCPLCCSNKEEAHLNLYISLLWTQYYSVLRIFMRNGQKYWTHTHTHTSYDIIY